jgi:hypothetical protein
MSDGRRKAVILTSGIFFLLVFAALTVVGLSSAEINFATVLFAGISLFVFIAIVGALIGAVRQPPEDEVMGKVRRREGEE